MDTLWRRSTGLDLAVEAGAAPVVLLLWQTPFYHADGPPRFRARLQSPHGLPTPCPESTSRSAYVERFRDVCLHPRAWRRRTMTPPFIVGIQPPFTVARPWTECPSIYRGTAVCRVRAVANLNGSSQVNGRRIPPFGRLQPEAHARRRPVAAVCPIAARSAASKGQRTFAPSFPAVSTLRSPEIHPIAIGGIALTVSSKMGAICFLPDSSVHRLVGSETFIAPIGRPIWFLIATPRLISPR